MNEVGIELLGQLNIHHSHSESEHYQDVSNNILEYSSPDPGISNFPDLGISKSPNPGKNSSHDLGISKGRFQKPQSRKLSVRGVPPSPGGHHRRHFPEKLTKKS